MLEQVSTFDQEIKFITGFAGSGKSTRLSSMATETTLVMTPTHKAASVLIKKGVKNVYTIYSVLGLVPTINENYNPLKKQKMQKLKKIGDTDLSSIKDIFIDEFSMISQNVLDLLLSLLPATSKITIFGDPYQLPPVDGEPIEPLLYTDKIEELTTQYRADAPEVVETFMRFMYYLKDGKEMNLRMNPKIPEGTTDSFNPDKDRILAYTNKKVSELNTEVAKKLNLPEEYSNGELLVSNGIDCRLMGRENTENKLFPNCISKGKLMEEEKLAEIVKKTMYNIDKFNTNTFLDDFERCTIEINGKNYSIIYDTEHYFTQKKLKEEIEKRQAFLYSTYDISDDIKLKDWCRNNSNKKGVRERGKAWSNYIAHDNLVFNLQRPFASTVHKAQGSEYDRVFIALTDIKKSIRHNYYEQYARLVYVALSRAQKGVIII